MPTSRSRRRFLKLVTAGSGALITGVLPASAQPKPARTRRARPAAVQAEIDNQKKYVANQLKAVRGYVLAPGSEMGFAFRPLRPAKGRQRSAR